MSSFYFCRIIWETDIFNCVAFYILQNFLVLSFQEENRGPIQLKFPVQIQIEIVGLLTRNRFVAFPGKFAWSRFTRPRSIDRLWFVHGNFKHIMNPWTRCSRCSDCTGSFAYTARSRKPVSEHGNYLITSLVTQASRAHFSRHSFSWRHCFHVIALNSPPHTVFILFNIGFFTPSSFKYHVFSSSSK